MRSNTHHSDGGEPVEVCLLPRDARESIGEGLVVRQGLLPTTQEPRHHLQEGYGFVRIGEGEVRLEGSDSGSVWLGMSSPRLCLVKCG